MATPTIPNWDVRLAGMLGVKPTPEVIKFFHLWSHAEGGAAENNPFNTTQPGFNTLGNYNSVGVKRYGDPISGLRATAATLKNGRYQNILDALSQGGSAKAMAQALASSPWGTGALVLKMLGAGDSGASEPSTGQPPAIPGAQAQSSLPVLGAGPAPVQSNLQALLQAAAPSANTVSILQQLGGTAAKAAQASQAPIPVAHVTPPQVSPLTALGVSPTPDASQPTAAGGAQSQAPQQTYLPIKGLTHGGAVPMVFGGDITGKYPNLHVQGNVDWQHINPRLLTLLQKEGEKRGIAIVINSGYRSRDYNAKIGGAQNSNHTRGTAVDAYVNGHPIGDVIPPEEWAKLGIRSGNTPGFFKGKRDPEHLDMLGIPVKGAKR